jgi:hypothetical protein
MSEQVEILTPHPELLPSKIAREIRAVAEDTQAHLEELRLPPIEVIADCSFRLSPRNFAGVIVGYPTELYICPDLAEQPLARIRGILYHEMGHILQWMEKFLTGRNELNGRDFEQDCDHKVESICGVKILYDAKLIQQSGPGAFGFRPRPKNLK